MAKGSIKGQPDSLIGRDNLLLFWGWWSGEICSRWRRWGENHMEPQIRVAASEYWRTFCLNSEFKTRLTAKTPPTSQQEGGGVGSLFTSVMWGGGGRKYTIFAGLRMVVGWIQIPARLSHTETSKQGFQLFCHWRWRNKSKFSVHPGDTLMLCKFPDNATTLHLSAGSLCSFY
jgi:hypothetical protein